MANKKQKNGPDAPAHPSLLSTHVGRYVGGEPLHAIKVPALKVSTWLDVTVRLHMRLGPSMHSAWIGAPVAVLNALALGNLPRTLRGIATELGAGLLCHPLQED